MATKMLDKLCSDIDARVNDIRKSSPNWPCQRGCDTCCKQLTEIPRLTSAEWLTFRYGIAHLSQKEQTVIWQRVQSLNKLRSGFFSCPALNEDTKSCQVYEYRPIACRAYGYYVEREKGLHCRFILDKLMAGMFGDVIWGNYEVVTNKLSRESGEARSLVAWATDYA